MPKINVNKSYYYYNIGSYIHKILGLSKTIVYIYAKILCNNHFNISFIKVNYDSSNNLIQYYIIAVALHLFHLPPHSAESADILCVLAPSGCCGARCG